MSNVGKIECTKSSYELVEFEEMIKYEKGCWLRFMKIPPANNEADAAAAKKPPVKGAKAGAQTEYLKPVFGRAWVNLKELSVNGSVETK